jgi:hypothetical protein
MLARGDIVSDMFLEGEVLRWILLRRFHSSSNRFGARFGLRMPFPCMSMEGSSLRRHSLAFSGPSEPSIEA